MSTKNLKFFVAPFLFLTIPFFVFASESIDAYEIYIKINLDSSIEVLESIDYNFGANLKRGIYREIETVYQEEGKNYKLDIKNFEVFNELGQPYFFEFNDRGKILRLDIGGNTPQFSGTHQFNIKYTVESALVHKEDYDSLDWNAIGTDWGMSIYNPSVFVEFPKLMPADELVSECYVGVTGSLKKCSLNYFNYTTEETNDIYEAENFDSGEAGFLDRQGGEVLPRGVFYGHDDRIGQGEGMTVYLKFPKGIVEEGNPQEFNTFSPIFFITFFSFIALSLFGLVIIFRKGSDPGAEKIIVRQYGAPEGITPSDAGLVLTRRFDNNVLVAELISLAIRGHIKIISARKKTLLFNTPKVLILKLKSSEGLPSSEKTIMEEIFHDKFKISKEEAKKFLVVNSNSDTEKEIDLAIEIVLTEKFKNIFYAHLSKIIKSAQKDVFEKNLFEKSFKDGVGEGMRTGFKYFSVSALGILLAHLAVYSHFSSSIFERWIESLVFGFFLLGLIVFAGIIISKNRLPRRTDKGVEVKRHLLGLKEYITVAEKERMDFHFDPKSNPELFERLLPFAVIMGVEKRWTVHLKDFEYKPEWYSNTTSRSFSAGDLSSLMVNLSFSAGGSSSGYGGGGVGAGRGGGGGGSR